MAETLGKVIRSLREKQGIKQQSLASEAGVSVQTMSNIESDKQIPSKTSLEKIAGRLGIPMVIIEALALDLSKIDDPIKRAKIEKSYKALRLLINDVYDLV